MYRLRQICPHCSKLCLNGWADLAGLWTESYPGPMVFSLCSQRSDRPAAEVVRPTLNFPTKIPPATWPFFKIFDHLFSYTCTLFYHCLWGIGFQKYLAFLAVLFVLNSAVHGYFTAQNYVAKGDRIKIRRVRLARTAAPELLLLLLLLKVIAIRYHKLFVRPKSWRLASLICRTETKKN